VLVRYRQGGLPSALYQSSMQAVFRHELRRAGSQPHRPTGPAAHNDTSKDWGIHALEIQQKPAGSSRAS